MEKKQEIQVVTLRVPKRVHEALKAAAYLSDTSINQLIMEMLRRGFFDWVDRYADTIKPEKNVKLRKVKEDLLDIIAEGIVGL